MIGYSVQPNPALASYRLRVDIPRRHLGLRSTIGLGSPTFFYKDGDVDLAKSLRSLGVVYDVVNDHFTRKPSYVGMCEVADVITCSSEVMRDVIQVHTGRDAVVIDDPYENDLSEAACEGSAVLWFGHSANLASLMPYVGVIDNLMVCSNELGIRWSLENEATCLQGCAVVLLTGSNAGASSNRVVKALRAGRFVIAPEPCRSWQQFAPYIWVGDAREGVRWALNNREEVCSKIREGQKYTEKFSPVLIGSQWRAAFESL